MLVGGADVSGDKQGEGQRNYIAFLVGTEERINRIYRDIGINGIHMAELSEQERQQVQNNLNCRSDDIRVWCFHVQRQHIEQYILNHTRLKNYKKPKVNVHKNFDHHLLNSIKNELENFVFPYRQEFSDIVVHTDGDMRDAVLQWKMQQIGGGKAFELADAIAWFNQKHVEIDSCMEIDLRDSIKESMERDLLE